MSFPDVDPGVPLITEVGAMLPIALWYDPRTRAHLLTALGAYAELDPVDHAAIFSIAIPLGSFPSSPTLGLDVKRLNRIRDSRIDGTFAQMVADVWRPLTLAKDLRIDATEAYRNPGGQILASASYTNLRTLKNKKIGFS